MTTPHKLKGILHNIGPSNICVELESYVPRASARMRRASPYMKVPISIPRQGSVNIAERLSCSSAQALDIINRTVFVQRLIRRGLLKVL